MSDLEGQQLGNYSLTRKIGEGAFAEVYVGEHVRLNTLAAIKVLHARLTRFETGEFLTEARTVANLDHRNIVRVLDFDVERDIPFLVLEYAPNGNLRQRHPKGSRVPLNTIVSYVKQIAAGLQYAHDKKLIHRDVKPENMLLKINDELLLSDFGLATIARSTQSLSIKQLEMAGTPYYMAPEQIQGRIRRASDQYALGVIVYEWISGTLPFNGSQTELFAQHQFAVPPPLHEKVPGFPSAIEQVVMKALAKESENRYPCVQDFADALEQAILLKAFAVESSAESHSNAGSMSEEAPTLPSSIPFIMPTPDVAPLTPKISTPVVSASSLSQTSTQKLARHKIPRRKVVFWGIVIGVGAVTTATAIELAAHGYGPGSTNLPPHHTPVTTQPFGTLLYSYSPNVLIPHAVFAVAWSPNGKRIASAWQDNTARVWDVTTRNHVLQYNKHSGYVKTVAWTPDSTRIASGSLDNTVRIWNAATELDILTPPYTGHTKAVRSVAWSHNGTLIASGSVDHTVRVWNVATGNDILHSPYTGHNDTVFSVAWSPDDKRIASGAAKPDYTVQVWEATTGEHTQTYTRHTDDVWGVAWSPRDGKYIASGSFDSTVQVWWVI
jgi:eukaryotic-like serine/threonine-protein kinase